MTDRTADDLSTHAAHRLVVSYSGPLPRKLVRDVIDQACADLRGQVLPEALPEMLHRLVRQRLELAGEPDGPELDRSA